MDPEKLGFPLHIEYPNPQNDVAKRTADELADVLRFVIESFDKILLTYETYKNDDLGITKEVDTKRKKIALFLEHAPIAYIESFLQEHNAATSTVRPVYLNNWSTNLPGGSQYYTMKEYPHELLSFDKQKRTYQDLLDDMETSIKESQIPMSDILLLQTEISNFQHIVHHLKTDPDGTLDIALNTLRANLQMDSLPIYIALRKKGYSHRDLVS